MGSHGPVIVRELDVPLHRWPARLGGVRIAHISDLHLRRWNAVTQSAQELLLALDYDLLVATGDFGNFRRHWRHAAELTSRFFEPLAQRGPVHAVLGNHDDPRIATAPRVPLILLRNERLPVDVRGATLILAGLEEGSKRAAIVDAVLDNDDEPTVLLAHYPSTIFRLPQGTRVDLVLSGHTHGGQIRLPKLGCIWPNDRIPRAMARGLHRVGNTMIHVSSGIGVSLPLRMRINCPPEIALLRLVSTAQP